MSEIEPGWQPGGARGADWPWGDAVESPTVWRFIIRNGLNPIGYAVIKRDQWPVVDEWCHSVRIRYVEPSSNP